MPARTVHILLMEDDEGDAELIRIGFEGAGVDCELHVVDDGEQGLRFLRGESPYEDEPRPDLILADLNMPRMDGHAFLRELGNDPKLDRIPIVVLTTSDSEKDVLLAYSLGANAYMTKPVGFDEFSQSIQAIAEYWGRRVRLPVSLS